VIAVPADFEQLYDVGERRFALDHEIATIDRAISSPTSSPLSSSASSGSTRSPGSLTPLFRFDQEAACDARVLDKARPSDRADYGRAIAKAASGRALLFASALDRRNTLHRRLKSMLSTPRQAGERPADC
jgi:hypothetical protein